MNRVGVDVVDVPRFRAIVTRTPRFVARVFTPTERANGLRSRDPAAGLAARFAAKEATMKAMGVGLGALNMHDIEVRLEPSGQPFVVLSGRALHLSMALGVRGWSTSLSHSRNTAIAVVLADVD